MKPELRHHQLPSRRLPWSVTHMGVHGQTCTSGRRLHRTAADNYIILPLSKSDYFLSTDNSRRRTTTRGTARPLLTNAQAPDMFLRPTWCRLPAFARRPTPADKLIILHVQCDCLKRSRAIARRDLSPARKSARMICRTMPSGPARDASSRHPAGHVRCWNC